ncbi:TAXI family TRAP transporter solute-binding subunit [Ruegeria sp. SCP11]|uniref:TAXI family TRAP transporter solute-binding subunit n=1 Tax=Ruegeria sp. SCP11 TaxID=3141378 RepID=UPI00333ADBC2
MKKLLTTSALAAMVSLGVSASVQAETKFITIGTGGPTGVYFVAGNAICRMIHKEAAEGRKEGRQHGFRCAAPSSNGSTYNLAQISQGEFEFGVSQSDWQYYAVNGTSDKVVNDEGFRAVFSVHPEPFQLIVSAESGIKSWMDLEGKKLNIGNPGSGQRGTTELLMERYGTDRDFFGLITEMTSSEHSNALCDGNIDAFTYVVGVPNSGVAVATEGCGAQIVTLNTEVEQKLIEERPFYAATDIPAGVYSSQKEDVTTFGGYATIVSHENVDPDVVYEVVRAVFENLDDFRGLHPAFANLEPESMINNGNSAPLHEGAARYYREKGWIE